MTEIGHYRPSNHMPLTPGARLLRGFKRVGLVLAIPIAICGVIGFLIGGANTAADQVNRYSQANCAVAKINAGQKMALSTSPYLKDEVRVRESGCDGPLYSETVDMLRAYAKGPQPSWLQEFAPLGLGGALGSVVFAGLIFGMFWTLGWVLAGFTKD